MQSYLEMIDRAYGDLEDAELIVDQIQEGRHEQC